MSSTVWIEIKTINNKKIITGFGEQYKLIGEHTTHPERAKVSEEAIVVYEARNEYQWGVYVDYNTILIEDASIFGEYYLKTTGEKFDNILASQINLYTDKKPIFNEGDIISNFNDETQEWEYSERGITYHKAIKKNEFTALLNILEKCKLTCNIPLIDLAQLNINEAYLNSIGINTNNGYANFSITQNIQDYQFNGQIKLGVKSVLHNKVLANANFIYDIIEYGVTIKDIPISIAKNICSDMESYLTNLGIYKRGIEQKINNATTIQELNNISFNNQIVAGLLFSPNMPSFQIDYLEGVMSVVPSII